MNLYSRAYIPFIAFLIAVMLAACTSRGAERAAQFSPDVQAQLATLQAPPGADPQVFAQLKDELARQLALKGKSVSVPPQGPENTPANVHFTDNGGGSFTLEWDYRNIGDYDQDQVVGVADITPLAMHFGHNNSDGLDEVIDVDNNGVGISDVTPIAQHFGTFFTGYSIRSDTSETGSFETSVGIMYLSEATGGTDGWKHFQYTFNPDPSLWYRVHSWDEHGGDQGQPCAPLMSGATVPAPVINSVSPTTGGAREELTMTADVTGTVADWAWDFGGGATPNTSTDASPVITLKGRGDYNASLTVANPGGSDTFNFTLSVADKWYVHKILDGAGYGRAVSAAFVGGNAKPCVAFSNDNDGSVMYARSTAIIYPTLTSDWVYMVADSSNPYVGELSLSPQNSQEPAILAFSGDKAEFISSSSIEPASGAEWSASDITVSLTGDTGSLNLLQGQLTATLHHDGALKYFEANIEHPVGPADWTPLIVHASGVINLGADAVTMQNPVNSNIYTIYRDSTSETMWLAWVDFYQRYTPASWVKIQLASGGSPGLWSAMAFDRVGSMMTFYTQKNPGDMIYWTYGIDTPALPADVVLNGQVNVDPTVYDAYEGLTAGFIDGDRWISTMRADDKSYLGIHSIPFAPATPPVSATFMVIDQPGAPTTISGGNAMLVDTGGYYVAVIYGRSDGLCCAILPLQ